jgi:hypothetical protein
MNAQQDPHERGPVLPPAELEGLEVRDVSGGRAGRVEDVYVDREGSATRYVALACDDPGRYRLVPLGVVRVEEEFLVIGLEGEHLSDAPTVPRDAAVTRAHEGDVAGYFRNLHDAGYMRPWAEPPQAGYMRPEDEPPEVHGAGRMDPRFLSAFKRWRE